MDIRTRDVPEQHVVTEQRSVDQAALGAWLPGAMARVATAATEAGGVLGTGAWTYLDRPWTEEPVFVVVYEGNPNEGETPVEVCAPIADAAAATRTIPAHREAYVRVTKEQVVTGALGGVYEAVDWPVATREVPAQVVLTEQRYVTSGELSWIREAAARLSDVARRHGGPAGPRFGVLHGEVSEDSDGPVEVCVPVAPGAVDPTVAATRHEPAHREAYIPVIRGHFEPPQILSVYDAARRWVRERDLLVTAAPREVYAYPTDLDHGARDDLVCDVAVPYAATVVHERGLTWNSVPPT